MHAGLQFLHKNVIFPKGITTTIYRNAHLIKLHDLTRKINHEDVEMKDNCDETAELSWTSWGPH